MIARGLVKLKDIKREHEWSVMVNEISNGKIEPRRKITERKAEERERKKGKYRGGK